MKPHTSRWPQQLADGDWQEISLRPNGYWETYHRQHNGIHQMISLNEDLILWQLFEDDGHGPQLRQADNNLSRLLETANTTY